MRAQNKLFLSLCAVFIAALYGPVRELFAIPSGRSLYSHIPMVPLISSCLIYLKRKEIFKEARYFPGALIISVFGAVLYLTGRRYEGFLERSDYLSVVFFSAAVAVVGGFLFFYGSGAFKKALFPLLFLFFAVPLPGPVSEALIRALLIGSAGAAEGLFRLSGAPFAREGSMFHLPGFSIEVASACSGIRSSLVLLMTGFVLSSLYLKTISGKVILIISVFPIAVFKNGLRIAALSLLGTYLDERVLYGSLHRKGGIVFFSVAFLILFGVLRLIVRAEGARGKN